jgi:hypothetical protein
MRELAHEHNRGALARLLVPYKVPPFTLPFNFAALLYLSGTGGAEGTFSTSVFLLDYQEGAGGTAWDNLRGTAMGSVYDWKLLLEAIPKGVGQVCTHTHTHTHTNTHTHTHTHKHTHLSTDLSGGQHSIGADNDRGHGRPPLSLSLSPFSKVLHIVGFIS